MEKKRILVVDDEKDICEILKFNLENEGYIVDTAYSAEQALKVLTEKHDLILLDVMMGGISGFQLANKLKTDLKLNIPIIFLTAKTTENDLLTGFSLGADDYIKKPFSIQEIMARVKAVFRRTESIEKTTLNNQESLTIGDITIDYKSKTVSIDNEIIELTKKEFLILSLLCQSPETLFSREQIIDNVWSGEAYILERSVDVHIARLRKKLGKYGKNIVNRPGFGYGFKI